MRYILFGILIVSVSTLSACTGGSPEIQSQINSSGVTVAITETSESGEKDPLCPEGQIMADTVCVLYTGSGNNTTLFGQDFEASVTSMDISSGSLMGYYVEPRAPGDHPGIIMIHEWWGLNDNIRYMARLLANSGYRVLAIDLYGEVATTPERARELATIVRNNPTEANQKMQLALEYLKTSKKATKVGTLGWCFGGQQSLNVSLETPVDATVIYYGNLSEDREKISKLAGPVLAIFGDKDTSIPLEKIELFQKNLDELGKDNTFYIYPGLGHAFANPSGANYAPGQTVDAWDKTIDFLEKSLK